MDETTEETTKTASEHLEEAVGRPLNAREQAFAEAIGTVEEQFEHDDYGAALAAQFPGVEIDALMSMCSGIVRQFNDAALYAKQQGAESEECIIAGVVETLVLGVRIGRATA